MDTFVDHIALNYGDAALTLFNIGVKKAATEDAIWHNHCYYELHFILEGSYTCSLEGRQVTVAANEFLIIPPQVHHWTSKQDPTCGDKRYVISLALDRGDGQEKLWHVFSQALENLALTPVSCTGLHRQQLEVFANKQLYSTVLGMCKLKAAGAELIHWLFDRLLTKDPLLVRADTDTAILIDNLVHRPDITLQEIADASNYSKRHISRLIRQRYGCTLSQLRSAKKPGSL